MLQERYVNPFTDFGSPKLFETAEIARFSPEQRTAYEDSLKVYRDLKNVIDTARDEGFDEGFAEGELNAKMTIIRNGVAAGLTSETLAQLTNLSAERVEKLMRDVT